MLNWLAGQKAADGPQDPDTTGAIEPPETPAPVFAVRAFKHAIFGTPQTNHAKPRRHSNTENARPKNIETKTARPTMNRPKSTSDAHTLAKQELEPVVESLDSPTKGILLTPGTAAARKKNVTFGENVVDNEEKRPMKSGLPEDCPGKFPSPWHNASSDTKKREGSPDKGRGRNKLTEAFEQVREDSRKRKTKGDAQNKGSDDDYVELGGDYKDPRSADGRYWKREYDIYRTNTQREVKKLITKQKAAKSFAQMKDTQCTDLADQLRQEQRKVEKLEARTTELAQLVRDLEAKLRTTQAEDTKQPEEVAISRRAAEAKGGRSNSLTTSVPDNVGTESRASNARTQSLDSKAEHRTDFEKLVNGMGSQPDPVQRPSEPYVASAVSESLKSTGRSVRGRTKSYQEQQAEKQLKSTDDIWAHLDSSSNPVISQSASRLRSANSGVAVTSGTELTPLQALNLNTLPTGPSTKRGGSPQSMDVECKSTPDLERIDSKNSPEEHDRHDSPLLALSSPQPSPELPGHTYSSTQRQDLGASIDYGTSRILASSPFPSMSKDLPSKPTNPLDKPLPAIKTSHSNNAKENISPTTKFSEKQNDLQSKPSVLWSSMNAPPAGKRNTSLTGKDGKELSDDRIAAARARIAARGRVTS